LVQEQERLLLTRRYQHLAPQWLEGAAQKCRFILTEPIGKLGN